MKRKLFIYLLWTPFLVSTCLGSLTQALRRTTEYQLSPRNLAPYLYTQKPSFSTLPLSRSAFQRPTNLFLNPTMNQRTYYTPPPSTLREKIFGPRTYTTPPPLTWWEKIFGPSKRLTDIRQKTAKSMAAERKITNEILRQTAIDNLRTNLLGPQAKTPEGFLEAVTNADNTELVTQNMQRKHISAYQAAQMFDSADEVYETLKSKDGAEFIAKLAEEDPAVIPAVLAKMKSGSTTRTYNQITKRWELTASSYDQLLRNLIYYNGEGIVELVEQDPKTALEFLPGIVSFFDSLDKIGSLPTFLEDIAKLNRHILANVAEYISPDRLATLLQKAEDSDKQLLALHNIMTLLMDNPSAESVLAKKFNLDTLHARINKLAGKVHFVNKEELANRIKRAEDILDDHQHTPIANSYRVLGLAPGQSPQYIQQAFEQLTKPVNSSDNKELAQKYLNILNKAYKRVLADSERKLASKKAIKKTQHPPHSRLLE